MGRVVGAFGLNGWVKVKVFTESADTLGTFPQWLVRSREGWREVALEDFEVHSKGPVANLAGCNDRDAADALRGAEAAGSGEARGRWARGGGTTEAGAEGAGTSFAGCGGGPRVSARRRLAGAGTTGRGGGGPEWG